LGLFRQCESLSFHLIMLPSWKDFLHWTWRIQWRGFKKYTHWYSFGFIISFQMERSGHSKATDVKSGSLSSFGHQMCRNRFSSKQDYLSCLNVSWSKPFLEIKWFIVDRHRFTASTACDYISMSRSIGYIHMMNKLKTYRMLIVTVVVRVPFGPTEIVWFLK
jgi:hypothetical protein